jgi:hypothetical protein
MAVVSRIDVAPGPDGPAFVSVDRRLSTVVPRTDVFSFNFINIYFHASSPEGTMRLKKPYGKTFDQPLFKNK